MEFLVWMIRYSQGNGKFLLLLGIAERSGIKWREKSRKLRNSFSNDTEDEIIFLQEYNQSYFFYGNCQLYKWQNIFPIPARNWSMVNYTSL